MASTDKVLARGVLLESLSDAELQRMQRFDKPADASRYALAHTALRSVLARYIGAAPDRLRFVRGAHGKPALAEFPDIHFSLSYSGARIAIAVAAQPVGIDVEAWSDFAYDEVAARMFSPSEQRALNEAAPPQRRALFFSLWTCKEAYVKATGAGIAQGLHYFDISAEKELPALIADRNDPEAVGRWRVQALPFEDRYSGALVTDGVGRIIHRLWTADSLPV